MNLVKAVVQSCCGPIWLSCGVQVKVTKANEPSGDEVIGLSVIPVIGVDTTISVIFETYGSHELLTYKSKVVGTLICASKQSVIGLKTGGDEQFGVERT